MISILSGIAIMLLVLAIVYGLVLYTIVTFIFFNLEEYRLIGFNNFYEKYELQLLIWFLIVVTFSLTCYLFIRGGFV